MIVYLVVYQYYDDFEIMRVFSSQEKATEYIKEEKEKGPSANYYCIVEEVVVE